VQVNAKKHESRNTNHETSMATATSTATSTAKTLNINRVEQVYDIVVGLGLFTVTILLLSKILMMTIMKFVDYYSRQIDRIVMDESDDEGSDDNQLSPYIPPRRSQRIAENRARCNSPLLVRRLKLY
jgi:hypothetical protein